MTLFGFVGLTAIVFSFCGVVQPKFEKPLLFTGSLTIASTSGGTSGLYVPGKLNGADRQSPAARSGASSSPSSSPSCAQGALIVGSNLKPLSEPAAVAAPDPAVTARQAQTDNISNTVS